MYREKPSYCWSALAVSHVSLLLAAQNNLTSLYPNSFLDFTSEGIQKLIDKLNFKAVVLISTLYDCKCNEWLYCLSAEFTGSRAPLIPHMMMISAEKRLN